MDNQNILDNFQKIMFNIKSISTCYDYNEQRDLLYTFLTKNDKHGYEMFIENKEEIDKYKDIIILNICTDFYLDSNYRINKDNLYSNSQKDVFETLDNNHTPTKILAFFKNRKNQFEAEIIIEDYFDLIKKDEFYTKKCINCAINSNKVFKLMIMNPLASLRYFNLRLPKSEIINEEIHELYERLLNDQTDAIFVKKYADKTKSREQKRNDYMKELNSTETIRSLYIELKEKIINSQVYLDGIERPIAYIISNVYETMKLSSDSKFQRIVDYIEKKENDLEQIIDFFINNNDFSNIILREFIKNYSLYDPEIFINHRNLCDKLGFTEILKKINPYYDIEMEECHRKLIKSTSIADTQHKTN